MASEKSRSSLTTDCCSAAQPVASPAATTVPTITSSAEITAPVSHCLNRRSLCNRPTIVLLPARTLLKAPAAQAMGAITDRRSARWRPENSGEGWRAARKARRSHHRQRRGGKAKCEQRRPNPCSHLHVHQSGSCRTEGRFLRPPVLSRSEQSGSQTVQQATSKCSNRSRKNDKFRVFSIFSRTAMIATVTTTQTISRTRATATTSTIGIF